MKKKDSDKISKIDISKAGFNMETADFASSIINNTSDAVIAIEINGEITLWNNGAVECYGYTSEEALGKNISILYRKEDLPLLDKRIKKVIQGENISNAEVIIIDKSKNERTVLLSINGIKDKKGKVYQMVGLTKDISEQKQAEIALKTSEENYRAIFEQSIVGIGMSKGNEVIFANKALLQIFNYNSLEEFKKVPLIDHIAPASRQLIKKRQEEVLANNGKNLSSEFQYDILCLNGEIKTLQAHTSPVEINGQRYSQTILIDVTPQKSAQQTLEKSEQRFEQAFNNSPIPISILNIKTGKRLAVNKSFKDTFGYTEEDLINEENIHNVNIAVSQSEYKSTLKKVLEQGSVFEHPFKMYTKSGEVRHVLLNASKAYTNNNDIYLTSYLDITARKKAEDGLRSSEEKFRNLAETAQVAISIFGGAAGKEIFYVNTYWENLTGYSKEEAKDLNIMHIIAEEHRAMAGERAAKRIAGEQVPKQYELKFITKSGETKWVDFSATLTEFDGKKAILTTSLDITKQKEEENQLIKAKEKAILSEEYLDNIINNIGDPFFVKDEESRILIVNDAFCTLFDLEKEHILGKTLTEDVSLDEQYSFLKIDKHVLKTGQENITEESLTVRGGETKTISTRKTRYIDSNNEKYLIGVIRDITERKIAEEQLKETLSQNELAVDMSELGVWELNVDSGELLWNDRHLEFYGITRAEFTNNLEGWRSQLHPDDKTYAESRFQEVFENKSIHDLNFRIIRPNGDIRYLNAAGVPIFIDGKLVKVIGVNRDITQSKESEKKLKESEGRIRLFTQNVPDFLLQIDKAGKINYINKTLEGLTQKDVIGTSVYSWIPEGFLERFKATLEKVFSDGTSKIIEYPGNGLKGEPIWFESKIGPLEKSGIITQVIIVSRDITERKKSELNLKRALKENIALKQQIEAENIYLREELKLEGSFNDIVGSSKSLKKVLKQVEQVAKTDSTVLILGETGTGKELIAKAIHNASHRNDQPMVKVNCSALPSNLIESELFGHEKGAFSGALSQKIGRFELANGGTIFLDEIGDLPIESQTRLLRVLQESEFERLGGEKTIKVDIRVITATNRNLDKEVENNKFRQDLYYRLNVFPIKCPPLRNRLDDIQSLVHHFINKYNHKVNNKIKTVHQKTVERLMHYNWPGNIRELEHIIERAIIMNKGEQLRLGSWFMDNSIDTIVSDDLSTMETVERDYIIKVLETTNWKIRGKNGAAEILGMPPTTLESRMKKRNIIR